MNAREQVQHHYRVFETEKLLRHDAYNIAWSRGLTPARQVMACTYAENIRTFRNADQVLLICGAKDPAAALRDYWVKELRRCGYVPAKWLPSWWVLAQWLLPFLLDLARAFLERLNKDDSEP